MLTLFIIFLLATTIPAFFFFRMLISRANLERPALPPCPRCKIPMTGEPDTDEMMQRSLFGVATCLHCGFRMDEHGREIPLVQGAPKELVEPVAAFDKDGKSPVQRMFEEE